MSAPLPTHLRVHRAISDIPEKSWDGLLGEEEAPFLEWAWLEALESAGSACPERGWTPSHLTLWRGSTLVAAAPAYAKSDSHGEFVFDWSWAALSERLGAPYFPKLVLAVPMTPAQGRRLLVKRGEDRPLLERELLQGALDLARAEGFSSVHVLFHSPDEARSLAALGFDTRLGVQYHWTNRGYERFEDFLSRFRSKRRSQIRRELGLLAKQGIEIRTLRGRELSSVDPGEVAALHASTVDRYLWGSRYLGRPFFERALGRLTHRVEVVEARRNGKLVAGAFNLSSTSALFGRYWGSFEEHPFLHFNVCLYHSVADCIRRGLARFEPGAGGEHKLVRGFEPAVTYSAHWIFEPRLARAVRDFLEKERAAILEGLPKWHTETGLKR